MTNKNDKSHKPSPKLLELLYCPITHESLDYNKKEQLLICRKLNIAYPIINGVPIMVPSMAKRLDEESVIQDIDANKIEKFKD